MSLFFKKQPNKASTHDQAGRTRTIDSHNFVHTDIFPKRFTPIIKKAFDARMDSDYAANQIIATDDLELLLADMKLFIATIKAWIEANPAT